MNVIGEAVRQATEAQLQVYTVEQEVKDSTLLTLEEMTQDQRVTKRVFVKLKMPKLIDFGLSSPMKQWNRNKDSTMVPVTNQDSSHLSMRIGRVINLVVRQSIVLVLLEWRLEHNWAV